MSTKTFAELGLSNAVCGALKTLNLESPFAVQGKAIPSALKGRDVLVRSPTGSGKTLAFGLPLCDLIEATDPRPSALVLAPTRELALQISEELYPIAHAKALAITAVFGGAGIHKQGKLASRSHILVATPGRLEDLLARGEISLSDVKVLVLDEADRMLDMGFQPAVDRIVKQIRKDRQTMFFSATLDGRVGEIAGNYTRDALLIEHDPPASMRGTIDHRFVPVERDDKLKALVEILNERDRGLTVVFAHTKFGADKLARNLAAEGHPAVALHGNRSQAQRRRALQEFSDFQVDVLVATDVAARGIDVEGVTHVVQYDIPVDHETYVHRSGRTARAGNDGIAITLIEPAHERDMGVIARELGLHREMNAAGLRVAAPGEKAPGVQRQQKQRGGGQGGRSSGHSSGGERGGRHGGGGRGGDRRGRGGDNDRGSRNSDRSRRDDTDQRGRGANSDRRGRSEERVPSSEYGGRYRTTSDEGRGRSSRGDGSRNEGRYQSRGAESSGRYDDGGSGQRRRKPSEHGSKPSSNGRPRERSGSDYRSDEPKSGHVKGAAARPGGGQRGGHPGSSNGGGGYRGKSSSSASGSGGGSRGPQRSRRNGR